LKKYIGIFREVFIKNNSSNEVYLEGDIMKRIKLGRTLRQIAEEGVETFYNGSLANQIINEIKKKGGILSLDDLRQYRLDFQEAKSINLNDSLKCFSSPPPSSGFIVTFILNIMIGFIFLCFFI
jgi:gamma-glutamyltranspeptidase